jgi:hypothetical protein
MGWVVIATPWPFTSGKTRDALYCTGGWVAPGAGLDGCGNSLSRRDSIPRPFGLWQVAIPTELSRPNELHRAQLLLRR